MEIFKYIFNSFMWEQSIYEHEYPTIFFFYNLILWVFFVDIFPIEQNDKGENGKGIWIDIINKYILHLSI